MVLPIQRTSGARVVSVAVLASALVLGCGSANLASAQAGGERVGFVLEAAGRWVAQGSREHALAAGGVLRKDETVLNLDPVDSDYLVLVGSLDRRTVRWDCRALVPCRQGRAVTDLLPQSTPCTGVRCLFAKLDKIMNLLEREPDRYAIAGSRSGSERPRESVVALIGGKADLLPAVEHLAPGRYRVRLTPVREEDRAGFGSAEGDLTIESATAPRAATISGLPPGLYEIEVVHDASTARGAGERAWILAASAGSYRTLAEDFRGALTLTAEWSDTAGSEGIRQFLRAFLYHLAFDSARQDG